MHRCLPELGQTKRKAAKGRYLLAPPTLILGHTCLLDPQRPNMSPPQSLSQMFSMLGNFTPNSSTHTLLSQPLAPILEITSSENHSKGSPPFILKHLFPHST